MILFVDECLFNMGLLNFRFCVMVFYHAGLICIIVIAILLFNLVFFFLYFLMET